MIRELWWRATHLPTMHHTVPASKIEQRDAFTTLIESVPLEFKAGDLVHVRINPQHGALFSVTRERRWYTTLSKKVGKMNSLFEQLLWLGGPFNIAKLKRWAATKLKRQTKTVVVSRKQGEGFTAPVGGWYVVQCSMAVQRTNHEVIHTHHASVNVRLDAGETLTPSAIQAIALPINRNV